MTLSQPVSGRRGLVSFPEESWSCWVLPPTPTPAHPLLPWPLTQGVVNPTDRGIQEEGSEARKWASPITWESLGGVARYVSFSNRPDCELWRLVAAASTSFLENSFPATAQSKCPLLGKLPKKPLPEQTYRSLPL